LLKEIKTGGISGALLKAKTVLGIESADEGELINAMQKIVLQQIKPTFGAQVSVKEGIWLREIEAGPRKSTEANIRLFERGLVLLRKRAEIGLKAAIASKDFRTAQNITEALEIDLTSGTSPAQTSTELGVGQSFTDQSGETFRRVK